MRFALSARSMTPLCLQKTTGRKSFGTEQWTHFGLFISLQFAKVRLLGNDLFAIVHCVVSLSLSVPGIF